jgi:hypothetical protein
MAQDLKYGKVTLERGDIGEDEPVFVLRGRDLMTVPVLIDYRDDCAEGGSPPFHLEMIDRNIRLITTWQEQHPDQVRQPDSESYRKEHG